MALPDCFPHGTEFLDVDSAPVTIAPCGACTVWDMRYCPDHQPFDRAEALRDGGSVDEAQFRALVSSNAMRATPARLVAAAKELQAMREVHRARTMAACITGGESACNTTTIRPARPELEAERIVARTIRAAKDSARGTM